MQRQSAEPPSVNADFGSIAWVTEEMVRDAGGDERVSRKKAEFGSKKVRMESICEKADIDLSASICGRSALLVTQMHVDTAADDH